MVQYFLVTYNVNCIIPMSVNFAFQGLEHLANLYGIKQFIQKGCQQNISNMESNNSFKKDVNKICYFSNTAIKVCFSGS